jgi:hypothetical protein
MPFDLDHDIGGALGEFFARQITQIVGLTQRVGDTLKSFRDERPSHERFSIGLPQHRLRRYGAIRKRDLFVACVPGPFVDVLEKVPVNGFQMVGVKLPRRTMTKLELKKTVDDVI